MSSKNFGDSNAAKVTTCAFRSVTAIGYTPFNVVIGALQEADKTKDLPDFVVKLMWGGLKGIPYGLGQSVVTTFGRGTEGGGCWSDDTEIIEKPWVLED